MKKTILLLLVAAIPFFLSACSTEEPQKTSGDILFFVSETCGHCATVKNYIKENNLAAKVAYTEIQAFETEANYELFNEKAAECGLPQNQRGVPLIYEEGKCYIGSVEGVDFFREKAEK